MGGTRAYIFVHEASVLDSYSELCKEQQQSPCLSSSNITIP